MSGEAAGGPVLDVVFYRTRAGNEPVREWLGGLTAEGRRAVGLSLKKAQYGWPVGLPLIRKLESGLWEVRTKLRQGIARTMFTVEDGQMLLLHGFVKKSTKMPLDDYRLARRRLAELREQRQC